MFIAVTAEEKGLLGSEYYAANPLYPAGKTAGVINTDGWRDLRPGARTSRSRGNAKLGLLDMLVAEGKKHGRYFTPDPHPEAGGFYRSDHFSFAKVGVPAISFGAGQRPGERRRRPRRGARQGLCRPSLPPAERRMVDRAGTSPAWPQDAELLHTSAAISPIRATGRTGAPDSEFRATRDRRRPPSAAARRRRRRESAAERGLSRRSNGVVRAFV